MKNNNITFSIIIPIHNPIHYKLERCINSILNQDFDNFEVFFSISDNCEFNCIKIIDNIIKKDKRFKKIISYNKGSLSEKYNIGIKKSKSLYLMFMNENSYISNDCLNVLYRKILDFYNKYNIFLDVIDLVNFFKLNDTLKSIKISNFHNSAFIPNEQYTTFFEDNFIFSNINNESLIIRKKFVIENKTFFNENHNKLENIYFKIVNLTLSKFSLFLNDKLYYSDYKFEEFYLLNSDGLNKFINNINDGLNFIKNSSFIFFEKTKDRICTVLFNFFFIIRKLKTENSFPKTIWKKIIKFFFKNIIIYCPKWNKKFLYSLICIYESEKVFLIYKILYILFYFILKKNKKRLYNVLFNF